MKSSPYVRFAAAALLAIGCFVLAACEGDRAVPITSAPSRKIDTRLLGDWKEKNDGDVMKVREFDDSNYVVWYGGDLYRAFHSEVAGKQFITVQDIEAGTRMYSYMGYELSNDGTQLELRVVTDKLIPTTTKDSLTVQKLLKQHVNDPELFGDKGEYVRQK